MHRSLASSRSVAASTPPDTRIYAVGDIHGRADLLSEIIARIDDDTRRRPIAHTVEVYLGDYIDRGPDSRAVLDLLAVRLVTNRAVCLRGNHEAVMEGFLMDPTILPHWLQLGGLQTLASYGIELHDETEAAFAVHRRFVDAFPRDTNWSCNACAINSVVAISCSCMPAFVRTFRSISRISMT
jgi:calcineurin-like phosphoesterase family protein